MKEPYRLTDIPNCGRWAATVYSSWRPNAAEMAMARALIRDRSPYSDLSAATLAIWEAVWAASGWDKELFLARKEDSYVPFESPYPWEHWKVFSKAWYDMDKRAMLRRLLDRWVPGLDIRPTYRHTGTAKDKEEKLGQVLLTFPRSAAGDIEDKVRQLEDHWEYLQSVERGRAKKKATYRQYEAVQLYESLLKLPDGHSILEDPEVRRASRKIRSFLRKTEQLWDRYRSLKPTDPWHNDAWEACSEHSPRYVESGVFKRAVAAAWRRAHGRSKR